MKSLRDEAVDVADSSPADRLWGALLESEALEKKLQESLSAQVARLLKAASFKEDETPQHIERIGAYCGLIVRRALGDRELADTIALASKLHDIGKLGIPDRILVKRGRLTTEEIELMRTHTRVGHEILTDDRTPTFDLAASIALSHHERFDGGGYPEGRSGTEIPYEARVAAIADAFDALTTHRMHRRSIPVVTALQVLRDERGRQFDPELLDVFLGAIDDALEIADHYRDDPGSPKPSRPTSALVLSAPSGYAPSGIGHRRRGDTA